MAAFSRTATSWSAAPEPEIRQGGRILVLDAAWQFPAITEQHAFRHLDRPGRIPDGIVYLAFPWATLIDKLDSRAADRAGHIARYAAFRDRVPSSGFKITVCQHINAREYIDLFRACGVDLLFWSHMTRSDRGADKPRIAPFPLYPVQMAEEPSGEPDLSGRPYLFTFIGSRGEAGYLSGARSWIIRYLSGDPRGLVVPRQRWHYHRIVYDLQIRARHEAAMGEPLVDAAAQSDFRDGLRKSIFSLCPSGSGPNSIRLWESLGSGAVPVILAESFEPPGPASLWKEAALFVAERESHIAALPSKLAEIAGDPDRLRRMRDAGRQLRLLYGPSGFVPDIDMAMLREGSSPDRVPRPSGETQDFVDRLGRVGPRADARNGGRLLDRLRVIRQSGGQEVMRRLFLSPSRLKAIDCLRASSPAGHVSLTCLDAPHPAASRRGSNPMQIFLLGRHAEIPLSRRDLIRHAKGRLVVVDAPRDADVIVAGSRSDLAARFEALHRLCHDRPNLRIAVVAEGALEDGERGDGAPLRSRILEEHDRAIPYTNLDHETSGIFAFDRLPYPMVMDDRIISHWRQMLNRPPPSARSLVSGWKRANTRLAYLADGHGPSRPDPASNGTAMRDLPSQLAGWAARTGQAGVMQLDAFWDVQGPSRGTTRARRHLEMLMHLDGQTRFLMATRAATHRDRVAGAIVDAFTTGAIPIHHAGPDHRIGELVPRGAFLDIHGHTATEAVRVIMSATVDMALAEAHLEARMRIWALLFDSDAILSERRRIVDEMAGELLRLQAE